MSEEKDLLSPAEAPETPPVKQAPKLTPGQQRRRQQSVFQYIAILFAAAFVLLMLTFFMEKRQFEAIQEENQEQIEDLQHSSLSAVNSLNQVLAENERLREQAAALEEQLQQKTQTHQSEKTTLLQTIEAREKALKAMDWFWQIDEAYVRGRYTLCRELIASLDEAKLMEFLPRESITENERFSPYDRLAEIREAVN